VTGDREIAAFDRRHAMKKFAALLSALLLSFTSSSRALEALPAPLMDEGRVWRLEVLQVTDIEPYQRSLDGFLQTLRDNGLVAGQNLQVHRVKIDFDVEKGGFWDKLGVVWRVRDEAHRIARLKPDLVLTIGTPATRYARGILDDAHVPVVFTAVANPLDAGCTSLIDAGPGATGATLYTDMAESMKVVHQMFPAIQHIGIVHTDDDNGIAHVQAARNAARALGLDVASREVGKSEPIVPALKTLFAGGSGAQMFAVPLDTYYGLRRYEPAKDLSDFAGEYQVPVVSFALVRVPGAMLYVGADFGTVGSLAGQQAIKILQRHLKPDVLPILKQDKPTVLVDPSRFAALKVPLPPAVVERKTEGPDGFWQIGTNK
jgi:putative ABC transport system substrate-binding protein